MLEKWNSIDNVIIINEYICWYFQKGFSIFLFYYSLLDATPGLKKYLPDVRTRSNYIVLLLPLGKWNFINGVTAVLSWEIFIIQSMKYSINESSVVLEWIVNTLLSKYINQQLFYCVDAWRIWIFEAASRCKLNILGIFKVFSFQFRFWESAEGIFFFVAVADIL